MKAIGQKRLQLTILNGRRVSINSSTPGTALERKQVTAFRATMRRRPTGKGWFATYGQVGHLLGLTYPEVYGAMMKHLQELGGTVDCNFVDRELTRGYVLVSDGGLQTGRP
jgi:hypothetical protein